MLKFVFFLIASFVTSSLALADGHETAIADPAEISFVYVRLIGIKRIDNVILCLCNGCHIAWA